ncbi:bifunctional 2',3'-cyclic-nucleotide 2'-phosphodiesterase/3'-nucleotidase [Pseudoduganella chitinolytica]|uniref:Bifunctional 2',3'-cyclic-nucleotide 2'-phosphodiesterase/3'-nucleotidase n=2 Tax=Pseudoduganella chitinolytica TaxID=34070 RepID=A0ABY8BH89_9BURK|nr:bifunctional 2',3'-cyclic-nucleotide 2'-phosphodiesterase/3'-nucleotidase [Pseudoduganella chitinolytica]WEF34733.1 bifunctional 2',3'-cyclic-nucleotide 2'-phosphodiesterase/3'-nucleotidase [Pseudoduganella chitinolytica]
MAAPRLSRICLLLVPLLAAGCATVKQETPAGSTVTLALLETTDLHGNVASYDYYKLAPDASLGLERTAALIRAARAEFPNTVLLDNGDTIQGTALADYQAVAAPLPCGETLAIYKVFNALGYDGAGVGNHDFNYGLAYLNQVTGSRFDVDGVDPARAACAGPAFPHVLANVVSVRSGQPLFRPYAIIDKAVTATAPDGGSVRATVKVGIIGFTPPTIMTWDKRHLEGKVRTIGVREAAERYVPEMRAKGADLVVAISHGGLDDSDDTPTLENGSWHLARVPGVDALLIGHSHQVFPNAASTVPQFNLPGVDKAKGTVYGVPTVMAGLWGKQLGVIGLRLRRDGARWIVDKERTTVEVRSIQPAGGAAVAADPAVLPLIAPEHEATIRYVKTPIGDTDFRLSTYFADVGDTSAIQVVNQAQAAYLADYVNANLPQYADLPVLSLASPFKTGSAGATDFTDVAAGRIALNNAADLYLYPNSLVGVKVDGAVLKGWLEKAAGRFNTIDPARRDEQELVDTGFAGFNFDMATSAELQYEIDVTQPPGRRIVDLRWRGSPVAPGQQFLVATNNYRAAGGGAFPGLDGSRTVVTAPDNNRDVLIAYIKQQRELRRAVHGNARSWRFAPVRTAGPVVFHSAPGKVAVARQAGIDNVRELRADDGAGKGLAVYAIELAK